MWQPWQIPANNSAPLDSENLEPGLSVALTGGLASSAASLSGATGKISARVIAAEQHRNLIIATDLRVSGVLDRTASNPDDARVQPRDGI
jgi:hypothetical protein